MAYDDLLFAKGELGAWLGRRLRDALAEVAGTNADEILARPHEQISDEIIERYLVPDLCLDQAGITGSVTDQRVDVSHDVMRAVSDRSSPTYIAGSRIMFRVPFTGIPEIFSLKASTFSFNPPRATVLDGYVSVFRDIPADVLESDRDRVVAALRDEVAKIDTYLDYSRRDIAIANTRLQVQVRQAAEGRRAKILADRDTEAILGVPLHRDKEAAKTYRVQPVVRRRVAPVRQVRPQEGFAPEPAITDEDFSNIVTDIVSTTRMFERLAVTYADLREERLRDPILTALHAIYGGATGETFSKRGKTDIYLPWGDDGPVFLAECKWWTGPKASPNTTCRKLLDRYIVWRDTHTAMVLFIRNKNATAIIAEAEAIIRAHPRYLRDMNSIQGSPAFVLHKDGDRDREITLELITAVIQR
ncbi:hypothetical protein [Fodinicola feengrottensis]|uniref:hypothetical protein n=1 Tax=Fodinicola feengrottensis TaxID=435914 RepID=UPI0013D829C6|nr:hypothetical protein [Fodinicola feengrottensis]